MKLVTAVCLTLATATIAAAQPAPPADPDPAASHPQAGTAATPTWAPAPPPTLPDLAATTPPAPAPTAAPTWAPTPPGQLDLAAINALIDQRLAQRLAAQQTFAASTRPVPKDGFYISADDGTSRLKVGGFTQFDGRFFFADSTDPHIDQFAFRSIRPDLQGTLFDHYDFRLFPDFAGGKLVVQDAYVDVRYGDAVKLRVGKFKVPFGLERLQAETATAFVERGLPTQVAPNRDLGAEVFGELAHGAFAYQAGVFNGVADGQSGDGDVSDDKEAAVRVFVKPFAGGDPQLAELGFGGAATIGDKTGTPASPDLPLFKTAGQTTFFQYKAGTTLADTVIADGRHWRATAQAYWYTGPIGLLAEYVHSAQHVSFAGSHDLVTTDAWQVLGQWVLTGEPATYKSVTPRSPFDPSRGQWGACDVVARVGELRQGDGTAFVVGFADPTKSARRAYSATGGIDWFLNRAVRGVLDFDRTWYALGAKTGNRPAEYSLIGRVQLAF